MDKQENNPPAYAPEVQPGQPGSAPPPHPQPAYAPGPQPGYAPGPQPGYFPGPQPGYAQGPQPGYAPGPQPGYGQPPPQQGYYPPQQPMQQQQNTVIVAQQAAPASQTIVVKNKQGVNHCLHCCITIFFFPWIIVWIILSKKRGLSLEEKRQRMQEIFFEKKGVFQLKEIEKIAPKEKGITPMAVKDVLQSLVDDGLVDSDRIGTSNYFWAFPSKASQVRKRKIQDLTKALDESEKKRVALEKTAAKSTVGKEQSDERTELLKTLSEKETENSSLDAELERFRECDPEVLEEVKAETVVAKEASNRWTDNVFSIKSWCKKKFNIEERLLDKQFGIPEDFDYLD